MSIERESKVNLTELGRSRVKKLRQSKSINELRSTDVLIPAEKILDSADVTTVNLTQSDRSTDRSMVTVTDVTPLIAIHGEITPKF